MRIVLTGASGGIGRSLMTTLGAVHDLTGIVRTPPRDPLPNGPAFVGFSDKLALNAALAQADCVIHCALDSKASGPDFLAVNRAMNAEILGGALAGRCRLYIFISSQVVFSGADPVDAGGYRESQPLAVIPQADDYTRLKLEGEELVIAACRKAGIDYLILRPTVVMGPGMAWSDGVVKASRFLTFGVRGRTMNIIHVDDLSRQVLALLETGARNEIFSLGTRNVSTDDYFTQVGALTGRPALFLPGALLRFAGRFMPSTLWFFARDVAINADKVAEATAFRSTRTLAEHFGRAPLHTAPTTLDALRERQRSPDPFRTHGQGYHLWFNQPHGDDHISMNFYSGIVALDGERLRVKAGTRLVDICDYLEAAGLQLPTLPEFLGISAGACFFVDVHGSSNRYFSLYDLIEEIRYLDDTGAELVSARDDALWVQLRERRSRFILTELTFRCEPAGWLGNRMVWEDEAQLDAYLAGRFRDDLATTIQWYPHYRKLLVYHVNPVAGPQAGAAPSVAPFRGLPYRLQKLLLAVRLRGRRIQVDRGFKILAPWRRLPFEPVVKWIYAKRRNSWRDVEMCMGIEDGRAFIGALRALLARRDIRIGWGGSVGLRFSHSPADGRDYVWVEFIADAPELVERVIDLARQTAPGGVRFHHGKYRPKP